MNSALATSDWHTLDIQNTLTYNWKNDIHDVTVMLGNEVSRNYGQWTSASARDFWSKDSRNISLTKDPTTLSAGGALNLETRGISYFGRVAYSLMSRYNLTATLVAMVALTSVLVTVGVPSHLLLHLGVSLKSHS